VHVLTTSDLKTAGILHRINVGTGAKFSTLSFALKAAVALRHIRPDVVNIHALDGHSILALLVSARVFVSQHGYHHFRLGRWLQRLRPSANILANSLWSMDVLHRMAGIRCTDFVYPLVPFPSRPDRSDARAKLGFKEDEVVVLHVGRCVPVKGQSTFLRAAQFCRERQDTGQALRFALVGDGKLKPRFENFVRRNQLAGIVRLAGEIPHEEIGTWFAAADIYVQPSVFDPRTQGIGESFGITVVEAMSAGLPLVLTDTGIFRELTQDTECALFFPQEDATALAERILQLCADSDLRRQMGGSSAKHAAEHFSPETAWAKYLSLLRPERHEAPTLSST